MSERTHVDSQASNAQMSRPWRNGVVSALALLAALLVAPLATAHDFGEEGQGGKPKLDDPGASCNQCPCESATAPGTAPASNPGTNCTSSPNNGGLEGGDGGAELGDPVEAFTGRYRYEHVDLELNGVLPIRMIRRYDSQSRYDSPLGFGWAFDYDVRLYEYDDGSVIVRSAWGQRERYEFSGGAYVHQDDARGRAGALRAVGNGYELRYPSGHVAEFDAEGILTKLRDAQGNYLAMSYQGNPPARQDLKGISPYSPNPNQVGLVAKVYQLTRIEEFLSDDSATGRYVTFAYDANGRLDYIDSFDGRHVDYDYVEAATPTFRGNLAKVTDAEGVEYVYRYQDTQDLHNLTFVRAGQGTTELVNVYDAQDRVVTQATGPVATAQRKWTLTYGAPNPQGERTTTVSRRVLDENGLNERFALTTLKFNVSGHVIQKIDSLGHRLTYARTNAAGNQNLEPPQKITITTERNTGTIQSPSYATERVVTLTLDADQNIASRFVTTNGETVTETWTYDHDWVESYQRQTTRYPGEIFLTSYAFVRGGLTPGQSGYDDMLPPENIHSTTRRIDASTNEGTSFGYDAVSGQIARVELPDVGSESVDIVRTYHTATPHRGLLATVSLEVNSVADPHLARSFGYDARAQLDAVTNANGHVTDFDFDKLGRLVAITQQYLDETSIPIVLADTTTVFSYTGPNDDLTDPQLETPSAWRLGNLLTRVEVGRTASEGQVRRMIHDPHSRLTRVERKEPSGPSFPDLATFAYDSDDLRVKATDGTGKQTRFAYDLSTQLVSVTDAANNATTFAYDVLGNRTLAKDAKNRDTLFSYDALSRLIQVDATAEGLVTEFLYDAAGNIKSVEDPKRQVTAYTYDGLSRLRSVTQPNAADTVAYEYDARSRLTRVVNARGNVLQHAYAAWGGLASVKHYANVTAADAAGTPDREVSYTHDLAGNVLTASDDQIQAGPLYTFSYDPQDRVDDVTAHYLPGTTDPVLDSRYDAFGHRTGLAAADATSSFDHVWRFDAFDRLYEAVLAGGSNPTLAIAYNGRDDVTAITRKDATPADHLQTAYTYFDQGPVDTITVTDLLPASTQPLLLDYGTPDATLNVDGVSETRDGGTAQAYDYDYDGTDRLVDAVYPAAFGLPADEAFAYDDAGNRDDASDPGSFTYNVNNQIETSPGREYVFDEDGNLEAITDDATTPNPVTDLTWDYGNRLQTYEVAASQLVANYRYDPFGRRIQKTVDADGPDPGSPVTTWYMWDGDRLLAEYDDSGVRQVRYAYVGGFAPVQVAYRNGATEDVYDVHSDHLDTPRILTDSSGAAVWRASYEAYGGAHLDPANTVIFNVRFPGQYYDAESGLHDNRYRYYSPELGRYISADPIGQFGMGRGDGGVFAYTGAFPDLLLAGAANTGNANVYSYALNRPLGLIDPLGLYSCTYSVGKHSMSCKANNPENPDFESDEAVSGQNTPDCPDCQNNPDRSDVQDAGPIPEGDYSIGAQRDDSSRRDLAPLPGTSTDPRFGFQTHGCSNAATCSEGCIGFTSNSARDGFNNSMSREEGDNTLKVVP